MHLDFFQNLVLIFLAVILFITVKLLLNLRKRKVLERKIKEYERLLYQAGAVRIHYLESLKEADDARKRVDILKEELTSQKIRLRHIRTGLRKLIEEMRRIEKKTAEDCLQAKTLVQLRAELSLQWAMLNKFRLSYLQALENLQPANERCIKVMEAERKSIIEWRQNRNTVMKLFNELSVSIDIANPREVLGNTRD